MLPTLNGPVYHLRDLIAYDPESINFLVNDCEINFPVKSPDSNIGVATRKSIASHPKIAS